MENKNILLHLSLIDGVGAATIAMMVQNKSATVDLLDLYRMKEADLGFHFGLNYQQAEKIKLGLQDATLLVQELALIEKHSVQWATILCEEYPALLSTIHMLPPVIYWRGSHVFNTKSIAIVGSRDANQYGKSAIQLLVPPLVEAGYVIVSGGALGADALAHQAAIEAGGKTVIVLGSGLLVPSPFANKRIFERAIECGGAMLSTFPLASAAAPHNFPARNRIISGLSKGSIIIQAAKKSGALITAYYALEQGRDVFAVPGSIHDPLSEGCHKIIAQGAKVITSAQDVLIEFGEMVAQEDEKPKKTKAKKEFTEQSMPLFTPSPMVAQSDTLLEEPQDMSPERVIIRACATARSTDELADKVCMDLGSIQGLLFELQMEGKIRQNFMGMWESR